MESRELRVGNNIKDRGGKTLKIDYFEYDKICQKVELPFGQVGHPFTENFEFLEPIPLTEEWLLKFGFEKKDNNWFSINYYTELREASEEFCIQINMSSGRMCFFETSEKEYEQYPIFSKKPIKHVHQLQNLYFALTDDELTLK